MTVFVDPARWPRHGRLWGHLISDASLDELHAFARAAEIPAGGFDLDHYDVPADLHTRLVELGAVPVTDHELIHRLRGSGPRITARERRAAVRGLARTDEPGNHRT